MNKLIQVLLLAGLLLGTAGCKNDIDTNADWKEIMVVYGLLNPYDTTHYIRVNKAFLSENQSALEIAKINDSLYFDSLDVKIEEYQIGAGTPLRTHQLSLTTLLAKDTGIFANYPNKLYTFTAKLDNNNLYKLKITNKISGNVATAQTLLVQPPSPGYPSSITSSFPLDTGKLMNLYWTAGMRAKIYDIYMRFYWNEYDSATNQLLDSNKFIDWPMVQAKELPAFGTLMSSKLPGNNFYEYIYAKIPGVIGKYRKATKVDFMYWSADEEFRLYREINTPSIGLVQKKPEYTNMSAGNYGLFASRNYFVVKDIKISPQTLVFLEVYDRTRHLKFRQ